MFFGASYHTWYAGVASMPTTETLLLPLLLLLLGSGADEQAGQMRVYHERPRRHMTGSPKKSFSFREMSPLSVSAPGTTCASELSTS